MLKEINNELKSYQVGFNGGHTIEMLSKIDISKPSGKLNLIIEVLKLSNFLKFKYFYENKPGLTDNEIQKIFAKAKSYSGNNLIISGQLKQLIEGLTFYLPKRNYDFGLIHKIVEGKLSTEEFIGIEKPNPYSDTFKFAGKSGTIYEGIGVIQLRGLNEAKCIDILEGYKGTNKRVLSVLPFLLDKNNREELKKEFSSYRGALLSVLSEEIKGNKKLDLEQQSKAINYILAKQSIATEEISG